MYNPLGIVMSDQPQITEAKMLARVLIGNAEMMVAGASVQRSHRFPTYVIARIENMAKMAGSSVSFMINRTLEAGLESVFKELPEDVRNELAIISDEQANRPTKSVVENRVRKSQSK